MAVPQDPVTPELGEPWSQRPSGAATRRDRRHTDPSRQPWRGPHNHDPTHLATSMSEKPRPARRALVVADAVLGDKGGDVTPRPSPKTTLLSSIYTGAV